MTVYLILKLKGCFMTVFQLSFKLFVESDVQDFEVIYKYWQCDKRKWTGSRRYSTVKEHKLGVDWYGHFVKEK